MDFGSPSRKAQQRVVKIYGAGGVKGLEAYQSGFLVSPEGHIATVWSTVLDVPPIVLLDDGRRFESELIHFEPVLQIAVLKIDATNLPFFEMPSSRTVSVGDAVLAVSNLFNIATGSEPASVMRGAIAAVTRLDARRGTYSTPYRGDVFVLDLVANNPGAAGGALVNPSGGLVGMLGRELRDANTGVWLNYAVPADVLRQTVGDIIAGKLTTRPADDPLLSREQSHASEKLGLVLVPDVLESTPNFVDAVTADSAASKAGLRPDDLILLVNGVRVTGQASFRTELRKINRRDDLNLVVQRGSEIVSVVLRP
ncbi:MAG: S1C family serine protease [Planctomycetota bacterium]